MVAVRSVLPFFTLFVIFYTVRQVDAEGTICSQAIPCLLNEICVIDTELDIPCQKGFCRCVEGYIAINNVCTQLVSKKLGDACTNAANEVLIANSECGSDNTVVCQTGFVVSSNTCIQPISGSTPAPLLGEGESCQLSSDCLGDMRCGDGARYICTCSAIYMRYDPIKKKCVRREFGDPCSSTYACDVYAHPWTNWFTNFDGYNYHEGRCHGGICICSDNGVTQTRITMLDDNATLITKTVCVVGGASWVKKGERCTLNPIGYGRSTQTRVCELGSVCYQCPEEYSMDHFGTQTGRCRVVKNKIAYDLQLINRQNLGANAAPGTGLSAGFDQFGFSITASTTTQSQETVQVFRKRVGDVCSTDKDCGTNEICDISTNVDTPCTRGYCVCKPCYAVDRIMDLCYPVMARGLNDICYESENEILPNNAFCLRGYVRCKRGYTPSLQGGDCVRQRGVGGYGDYCEYTAQCIDGLRCNREFYMCDCLHPYEMWNNDTQKCIYREFGDSCSDENECRVPGGNWTGFTYAGGMCFEEVVGGKKCRCGNYNRQVTVGFIDHETGVFRTKIICVSEGATLNVAKGERCTVDPIMYGQQPSTRICGTSNMCYQCPEDYLTLGPRSMGDGYCRAVSRQPPKPDCSAYLTTTTVVPVWGI